MWGQVGGGTWGNWELMGERKEKKKNERKKVGKLVGVKGQQEVDSLGMVLFFSGLVCVSVCLCVCVWGGGSFFVVFLVLGGWMVCVEEGVGGFNV